MSRTRRIVCVVIGGALIVASTPFVMTLMSGAYPLRSGFAALMMIGLGGLLAVSGLFPKIMDRY